MELLVLGRLSSIGWSEIRFSCGAAGARSAFLYRLVRDKVLKALVIECPWFPCLSLSVARSAFLYKALMWSCLSQVCPEGESMLEPRATRTAFLYRLVRDKVFLWSC